MLRRAAWILPVLLFAASAAHAQTASVRGQFLDASSHGGVSGVLLTLTRVVDSTDVHRALARDDGSFAVDSLGVHGYWLETRRLGYAPLRMVVRVTRRNQDLGVIALTSESVPVRGVTVRGTPPVAAVKGDTTEFRAGAVQTHRDATAEDLVQKLPGVTMENGQIKAQGEAVQNVLVNGRPFFGSDPTAAMRNLPAEVVDRIQVYDRMSDQAEFSGFDDGQSQKTMNFILKDRQAKFGKVYGGYGDQDRYQGGGNLTTIHGGDRLTWLAMSNNINQRNFSPQDLFGGIFGGGGGGPRIMVFGGGGGGFRPGGGERIIRAGGGGFGGGAFDPSSFLVNPTSGISTTHSGGVNWVVQRGPKLSLTSSVFLNRTDNEDTQTLTRAYVPPQDSLAGYDQVTGSNARNDNQRVDTRLEWTADSSNSIIFQPRLYFSGSHTNSLGDAANRTASGDLLSASSGATDDDTDGNNLSGRLTLRHRFARRGRNVSADLNVGHTRHDQSGAQLSLTEAFYGDSTAGDTLDQRTRAAGVTNSFSTRVAWTEPLRPHLQMQAIYNPSVTRSENDARTLAPDPATGQYALLDVAHSNSYRSRNTIQNGGMAMLLTGGPWKLLGNASWQRRHLSSEETFPAPDVVERAYDEFLPSATLTGNFANRRNLRLAWTTSSTAPTISQLQNVVNNANPLSLQTGNPGLRPTYGNTLTLRLSEANPMRSQARFLFANLTRTSHTIANAMFTALRDTTIDGATLARGTQLTRPVNLGDSWSGNLFGVYSRPAAFLKSQVSVNAGGTFNRTPARIQEATSVSTSWALRSGLTVSSNISPNLDFTVSYQGTVNLARNTLSTGNTGDYYTHTLGVRFNAVAAHGIVVRQELNHNLQSGVPSAYGQDVVLWNTTLGKKFLRNDAGELRVTATDVLEQNAAVSRSITESYVQDSRDRTLRRFVQAVFTYTFR